MKNLFTLLRNASLQSLIGLAFPVWLSAQCVNPPAIPNAAVQNSNCGQAAVLTASGSSGNYRWYTQALGGTQVHQGNSYTTPVLYGNTTYYVEAFQSGNPTCASGRVALIVNPTPLASPSVQGANVTCGASATITASGSSGNYFWYAGPTGGPVLATGNSFTTAVTQTTIFYVEASSVANPNQTVTFNYTGGQQNWTVPAGVFSINFDVRGAQGGTNSWNNGGTGGRVTGKLAVTPGQTLYFYVGNQPGSGGCCSNIWGPGGWNGGGSGFARYSGDQARGGGGASDIRVNGTGTNNRVVVAGGGGGAGGQNCNSNRDRGGNGGGLSGQHGFVCDNHDFCFVGQGGTQNNGGSGAQCYGGSQGSLAQGGNAWGGCCGYPGGGGGGGYYGGGGGAYYGGGGGGSSFANPNSTISVVHTQGFQSGNGQIIVTYVLPYCTSARVPVQVATSPIPNPTVASANLTCGDTALLQATGTGFFNWYSASTGGTLLQGNSASYTIPFVTDSMTVWVEALSTANTGGTINFSYTGGVQSWTVPAGVYSLQVDARGARGSTPSCNNGSTGGNGGQVQATLAVTPGQTLHIYVGGTNNDANPGWNGGGNGGTISCNSFCQSGGGGGATDIRIGGQSTSDRKLVAGGGGGGGGGSWCNSDRGGAGGGLTGQQGYRCNSQDGYTGTGGTQNAGGNAGTSCNTGQGGSFGQGGNAYNCSYAGGGGGGWYGGGGGTGCWSGGGGGGGSSYTDPNICSQVTHNQGTQTGNGSLSITYSVPYCQSQRVAANVNVAPLSPPTNVIGDSVLCGQTAVVSATAGTTPVHWFTNLTSNAPLAIGPAVFLPAMYGSDTLFATSARINTLSGNHTFNYTGAVQTWTVPAGITSINVDMSGAEGGAAVSNPSQNLGGKGGRVQTTLSVTPGQILNIYVGEKPTGTTGGWNGGGNTGNNSGGGGGGTDIRIGGITLQNRVISAGAGGGAGYACGGNDFGGDGGGNGNAANGIRCGQQNTCHCGFGASPTSGGGAAQCCNQTQQQGSLGKGGDRGTCYSNGGGGGGGHYGGGGGGDGGGGGGSSYTDAQLTSNTTHTQGFRSGHGVVNITYNATLFCGSARVPAVVHIDSLPAPTLSADVLFCDQGSNTFTVSGGPNNAQYRWFDGASGNLVGLGNTYNSPVVTQTDSIFVLYLQNGCPSKYDVGVVQIVPTPRMDVMAMGPFCSSDNPLNGSLGMVYNNASLTFINAGKTGQTGPSQANVDQAYGPGVVSVTDGVQQWTVPVTGTYTIEAFGASGGDVTPTNLGGLGAHMKGNFQLQAGQTLNFMVGQMGLPPTDTWNHGGGGGGGTFVTLGSNYPTATALIVAGGGGGGTAAYQNVNQPGQGGQTTNNGDGGGQQGDYCDNGGAGFSGNSLCNGNAKAYKNNGRGGQSNYSGHGGFGGGGAAIHHPGGGGGGYEGGRGGYNHSSNTARGGGSFNAGTNQANVANANFGHGKVMITGPMSGQPSTPGGVWSGSGITDTVAGVFDPGQAQIGNNTIRYQVNNSGCIGSDSIVVQVIQGPNASITTTPATYCDYDGQDTIVALNPNGVWTGTGVVGNNTQAFFNPSMSGSGTYYAVYTIADAASGCTDTDSIMLQVNPAPNAHIASAPVLCSNSVPVSLNSATPGGTWSGQGIVNPTNGNFNPANNVTGNSMVYYTVTVNNCTSNDSMMVMVYAAPNASFNNAPTQVCQQGNPVLLSNATPGGIWYGAGISNQNSGMFNPALANNGINQVMYMVSNANCSDADTVNILVTANPVVTINPLSASICSGTPAVVAANGATNYQWYINGQIMQGNTGNNISAIMPGTYTVIGTDANGCTATSSGAVINVASNPVIYNISAPAVCEGQPTLFTQNSAPGTGSTIATHQWNFGNGNTGLGAQTNETYATAGTYTAQLTVITTDGCVDSLSQNVTVNALPSIDSVQVTNNCFPGAAQLAAFVSGTQGNNYVWNFGGMNGGVGSSLSYTFPNPGSYNYLLTVTSANGCVSTDQGSLQMHEKPHAEFYAPNACQFSSVNFSDLSSSNVTQWNWDFGPGTSALQNPSFTFQQAGSYPVLLTVTTANGCTDSYMMPVSIAPTPSSAWTGTNMSPTQASFLPNNYPTFGVNYFWSFGDGTTSNLANPVKTYTQPGWYIVCLTSEKDGCESTTCQNFRIYDIFGIDGAENEFGLTVQPNPFQKSFNIGLDLSMAQEVSAELLDVTGRKVGSYTFGKIAAGKTTLQVNTADLGLAQGMYTVAIQIEGRVFSTRLIKE
jgi:PKD repeat protein